ncbi:Ribosomal RNA small subunit methyltransferase E [Petrocella atlantisensis]|uniref:Ribosomal RNA small subunit methyltransferase E n=1 Tax=Petrocella atlantisensis TaxID=2173034 RepID=A0A3P7P753_9FIRM|nr:16S rRNA (uracil(1498)-N(3))-methyltransferase [Petrocella atlantisensis]VDN49350.1 Ribosomal RNA small subunit methyltransferase E [Petrocella atlantisensis]
MYRFFVEPDQVKDKTILIEGANMNHMKQVLRLRVGDVVTISDGQQKDYRCIIKTIMEDEILLDIDTVVPTTNELLSKISLFQGIPKKDKMEWIIQKNIELGVCEIIPVKMKRCVVKLDDKTAKKKVERWEGIAEAAAKQSKRSIIPVVQTPVGFKGMMEQLERMDLVLVPYENADGMAYTRTVLGQLKGIKNIGIVIGPEGGFDQEEINHLMATEAKIISLGRRILRTETAGMTLLANIMIQIEEDNDGN